MNEAIEQSGLTDKQAIEKALLELKSARVIFSLIGSNRFGIHFHAVRSWYLIYVALSIRSGKDYFPWESFIEGDSFDTKVVERLQEAGIRKLPDDLLLSVDFQNCRAKSSKPLPDKGSLAIELDKLSKALHIVQERRVLTLCFNALTYLLVIAALGVVIINVATSIPGENFINPWKVAVFSDREFKDLVGTHRRDDVNISSSRDFKKLDEIQSIGRARYFSMHLQTCFKLEQPLRVKVSVKADDEIRVILNDASIDDTVGAPRGVERNSSLEIPAGYHHLLLKYVQHRHSAYINFEVDPADPDQVLPKFYAPLSDIGKRRACIPQLVNNSLFKKLESYFRIDL